MRAQFEKVTFGGAPFLVVERVYREFPMYWHYHPEFQLTLIVDSQGQRLVGMGLQSMDPAIWCFSDLTCRTLGARV